MDMLFFAAILTGLLEGLAQYLWIPLYFNFGVPILVAQLPVFNQEMIQKRELLTLKAVGRGRFLVRQKHYGIARYAYCHGVVRAFDNESGHQARCTLFVDWNVLIIGAFIFCAMSEFSGSMALLGVASGIVIAIIIVGLNRRNILLDCARAMAFSKATSDLVL